MTITLNSMYGHDANMPALVAVHVPNMGRMAIHRNEAQYILQGQPAHHDSANAAPGASSCSSSSSSSSSSSTAYTALTQPLSQSSEEAVDDLRCNRPFTQPHQKSSSPSSPKRKDVHASAFRPRLQGVNMPFLDWPDSPTGPWNATYLKVAKEREQNQACIKKWLDSDSDADIEANDHILSHVTASQHDHHPMVAKALIDRRRKEKLIQMLAATTNATPTKSSKHKRSKRTPRSSMVKSSSAHKRSNKNALKAEPPWSSPHRMIMGCSCDEEGAELKRIQCTSCQHWFHLSCVGMDSHSLAEWWCSRCSGVASDVVSPDTHPSLSVTPNFPRSATLAGHSIRQSQGQVPVFCQPSETPVRRKDGHNGFSSALALAPSPVMLTSDETARRNVTARSRASRVGWQFQEPDSPLQHKIGSEFHRRELSFASTGALSPQARYNGKSVAEPHPHDLPGSHYQDAMSSFLKTPSPRLLSTPKRVRNPSATYAQRSNGYYGASTFGSGTSHRRETSAVRDFDDIFSTPSRMLHGSSSWGQHNPAFANRHAREDSNLSMAGAHSSTPWGLNTPTKNFMEAGFSSDYSGAAGGLPSLVHSSGGLEMEEFSGWHHLQNSPTSSTRAGARASRSYITSGSRTSSLREHSPDTTYHEPNSSPFPKTPTISFDGRQEHHYSSAISASRRLTNLSQGLPISPNATPTRSSVAKGQVAARRRKESETFNSLQAPAELMMDMQSTRPSLRNRQPQDHTRKPSTDVMAGLGIGLDLNDGKSIPNEA